MPCLRKEELKMVESGAIVEYLEKEYPEPPLSLQDDEHIKVQSSFFPALATFLKSPEFQADLEANLLDQVGKLNDHLASKDTKYFAGNELTLVDFSLAPKLFHMMVTLEELHPETLEKVKANHEALNNYIANMFEEEAFKAGAYDRSVVIWGWKKHQ